MAVLMEEWPRLRNMLRILFALPIFLSPAIVGIVWKLALNEQSGVFTHFLRMVFGEEVRPLSSPTGALTTIIAIDIWQWTPFVVLLVSIGLEAFKKRFAQLVVVDHLSPLIAFRYIWMPLLLPTVGIAALFRVVDCLRIFDIIQTATSGGPGASTESLSLFTYKNLIKFGNYGFAAASAVVLLLLATIFFMLASQLFFRGWNKRTRWVKLAGK